MENNQTQQQGDGNNQQGENQQIENNQNQQQEKLFTQDDVNRIVGERLARERNNATAGMFAEKEHALNQRELKLDAREKLADAGLPKELLNAINCNSKKEMEESINTLKAFYQSTAPATLKTYQVSTGVAGNNGGNGGKTKVWQSPFDHRSQSDADDPNIRKAMGLRE